MHWRKFVMELRQLEAFVVVSELKSFSKAAEYLYLSQSTISSHIKNLENELKKSLITRTTKSLQLTSEGEIFLRYAKRILETKDAAIDALNSPVETILHLGASTIPSAYLLPSLLHQFHKLHPYVYFDIKQGDSHEILERILDGTVELGFIGKEDDSGRCINIPCCTDDLVLVTPATPYYLSLSKKPFILKEFLKEPMIIREQGSGTKKASDLFLEEENIPLNELNIIAQINDLESIKQMIVNGMGISILSRFSISNLEKRGQVLTYPLQSTIQRDFYISYLKTKGLSPILQEFVDFALSFDFTQE